MEFEFDAGPADAAMSYAPAPAPAPPAAPMGETAPPAQVAPPDIHPAVPSAAPESEDTFFTEEPEPDVATGAAPSDPSPPYVEPPSEVAPPYVAPTYAAPERPRSDLTTPVAVQTPAPPVAPPAPPEPAPSESAPPPTVAAREPAPELVSPTLAELYFKQGFIDKAVEVYRQLVEREPGNERLRRRLAELQAPPAPAPEAAARKVVLERTIARLEGMLAALKKG